MTQVNHVGGWIPAARPIALFGRFSDATNSHSNLQRTSAPRTHLPRSGPSHGRADRRHRATPQPRSGAAPFDGPRCLTVVPRQCCVRAGERSRRCRGRGRSARRARRGTRAGAPVRAPVRVQGVDAQRGDVLLRKHDAQRPTRQRVVDEKGRQHRDAGAYESPRCSK